jgi:hypothetical protein
MQDRDWRQLLVGSWAARSFGIDEALSYPQRGIRLLEEAAEAAQVCGVTEEMAVNMMRYVWSRPSGNLEQELGGVGVTLLALAHASGRSADMCEQTEITRVLNKPTEHFVARNKAKNDAGFKA